MDDRTNMGKGNGSGSGGGDKKTDTENQSEGSGGDYQDMVRRHLKVLLLHLAAKSDNPSVELEALLHDVINELHKEVKDALEAKTHLRLVVAPADTLN